MGRTSTPSLEQQMQHLIQEVAQLRSDLALVKEYVAAKLAKKEARKERERQAAIAEAKARRRAARRYRYDSVVSEFRSRPWRLLQIPDGVLSPREEETLALLAHGYSDDVIAQKMNLRTDSIPPRLCAARKKLGMEDRAGLIEFYREYKAERAELRNAKLWTVIGLLLKPPPGEPWERDYPFRFERRLAKSRKLDYRATGIFVADRVFNTLTPYKHNVMLLKSKGLSNQEIADRLKLKVSTIPNYVSEVRSHIRFETGSWIRSEAEITEVYARYAVRMQRKSNSRSRRARN